MRIDRRVLALLLMALAAVVGLAPAVALAEVPFGSLAALQRRIVTGTITESVPEGRFVVARYDDYGRLSYQVAALKGQRSLDPLIVIIGGSAVRECITDDDELRRVVAKRSDVRIRVVTLACAMQRLPSTLAIIDNLPRGSGIVVLGVRHTNFVGTFADADAQLNGIPILLTSKALHDFMAGEYACDPPDSMTVGLQKYLDWYARSRGVPAFQGGETTYMRHRYDARGHLSLTTKQAMVPRFVQNFGTAPNGAFFTYFNFNAGLLRECVRLAHKKGYQVLLMEDPLDTAAVGTAYDTYEQMYLPACQEIARQNDAHYVDINQQAGLLDTDFYDLSHLLASGRAKWTPKLTDSLVQILHDHPAAGWRHLSWKDLPGHRR
jgi:hypothetical protein